MASLLGPKYFSDNPHNYPIAGKQKQYSEDLWPGSAYRSDPMCSSGSPCLLSPDSGM